MKCTECRKLEAIDTIPEKIASWIVKHLFPNTLKDEVNSAHTKGFESGYLLGRTHERELLNKDIMIDYLKDKIPNV